jgi:predicted Zn-dependent protease
MRKTKFIFLAVLIILFIVSMRFIVMFQGKTSLESKIEDHSEITKLLDEAQFFINQAKPEKAKKFLDKAKARLPKDVQVLRQMAGMYISLREKQKAKDALMKIIVSSEGATSSIREWAHSQYYNYVTKEEGGVASAVKRLEEISAREPDNIGLSICIAEGYLRLWEREKAIKIYEDLNKKNPDDKEIFYCLITQYMNLPNYTEIIKRLEPLVKVDPLTCPYTDILGNAYLGANRIADYLSLYADMVKKNSHSASIRARYAQALMSVNKLEESVKEWEKVFELDPSNLNIKEVIADIYDDLGKKEEARKIRKEIGDLDTYKNEENMPDGSGAYQMGINGSKSKRDE